MKSYKDKGKHGEEIASDFLEKKDYKIIQRNFNAKFGEIDIICRRNEIVVFVEVKWRNNFNYRKAYESINMPKTDKIRKSASVFLQEIGERDAVCRFDVIIIFEKGNSIEISHIRNAF